MALIKCHECGREVSDTNMLKKKTLLIAIILLGIGAILGGCAGAGNNKRDLSWINGTWYCPHQYGASVFSQDGVQRSENGTITLLEIFGVECLDLGESLPYSINGDYLFVENEPAYFLNDSTNTLYKCHVQALEKLAPLSNNASDNWMKGYWLDDYNERILKISDKIEVSEGSYGVYEARYTTLDFPNLSYMNAQAIVVGDYMSIPSFTPRYWFNANKEEIDFIFTDEMCRFDEAAIKAEQDSIAAMDKSWMYGIWVGTDMEGEDAYYEITPTKIVYINPYSEDYEEEYQIEGAYLLPKEIAADADALMWWDGPRIKISPSNQRLLCYDEPMRLSGLTRNLVKFNTLASRYDHGFMFVSADETEGFLFFPQRKKVVRCKLWGTQIAPNTEWDYKLASDKIMTDGKARDVNSLSSYVDDVSFDIVNRFDGLNGLHLVSKGTEYHARVYSEQFTENMYSTIFGGSPVLYLDEVDPTTNPAARANQIQMESIKLIKELNNTIDPNERQRINNRLKQLEREAEKINPLQ